jgi:hypothetical protein
MRYLLRLSIRSGRLSRIRQITVFAILIVAIGSYEDHSYFEPFSLIERVMPGAYRRYWFSVDDLSL